MIGKSNYLTEDEKQILFYCFVKNTRSNILKVDDGVVQELVMSRIIYRSTRVCRLFSQY
ncbi:super-infection exclusion protein B [Oceanimonas smirnovii]|uniref:super-infection exclusion protein B n=1 Tax=Oceanimonas smirnovii TaxID=264574 RepID=UPI003FD207A6